MLLRRRSYAHTFTRWEYLSHLDHDRRLVRGVWPWRWPLTTWVRAPIITGAVLGAQTCAGLFDMPERHTVGGYHLSYHRWQCAV